MYQKLKEQQEHIGQKLKNKFKAHFHPLGSTKEQRIRAWKDMRWDPIKEAIDDFAYRYKELGLSLGLQQESIFDNFKACISRTVLCFCVQC